MRAPRHRLLSALRWRADGELYVRNGTSQCGIQCDVHPGGNLDQQPVHDDFGERGLLHCFWHSDDDQRNHGLRGQGRSIGQYELRRGNGDHAVRDSVAYLAVHTDGNGYADNGADVQHILHRKHKRRQRQRRGEFHGERRLHCELDIGAGDHDQRCGHLFGLRHQNHPDSNYSSATSATVSVGVTPATPTINWAQPAAITYGTALSTVQLDATLSVAGSCTYSPAFGAVLAAGTQTLTANCTPTNTVDYKRRRQPRFR